jgi:hypothetical protein
MRIFMYLLIRQLNVKHHYFMQDLKVKKCAIFC